MRLHDPSAGDRHVRTGNDLADAFIAREAMHFAAVDP